MELIRAILFVKDFERMLAFYRDALGLDVLNDVASGGFRWVTLGSGGGTEIVLSEPHAGRSQADGDTIQELLTKGVMPIIVVVPPASACQHCCGEMK